jgi:hypothetical protein
MEKSILKDIVHQMIGISMQQFENSFDGSNISDKDKEYCFKLLYKYEKDFLNKVKNEKIKNSFNVLEMVNIGQKIKGEE